jgi:hypothetical protein
MNAVLGMNGAVLGMNGAVLGMVGAEGEVGDGAIPNQL